MSKKGRSRTYTPAEAGVVVKKAIMNGDLQVVDDRTVAITSKTPDDVKRILDACVPGPHGLFQDTYSVEGLGDLNGLRQIK